MTFNFTADTSNLPPDSVVIGKADEHDPLLTHYNSNSLTANELVVTGGGNNQIKVYDGNDSIEGGMGHDSVVSGNGESTIIGGGGQDEILVGKGNNEIYVDEVVDLDAAIDAAKNGYATGQQGTLVGTGDGDNTIVGGVGNDLILVGQGNNVIIAGPGNDTISAGNAVTSEGSTWTARVADIFHVVTTGVTLSASGYPDSPNYQGVFTDFNGLPVGMGNDTIYGGKGDSVIFLSNGDNYVDAGGGDDSIAGGMGRDTIFGGTGNVTVWGGGGDTYIDGETGNDYLVGQGGNNTIFGGSGNDTIFAGDDSIIAGAKWSSAETGDNYVDGGSGNSQIWGSGGNDTLIGGTGNVTIYGGAGNEYIETGDGDDSVNGGDGTDVIVLGDGTDTVFAGSGDTTVYGGDGTDYIEGGSGSNVLYAGDGGTADRATTVWAGDGNTTIYGGFGTDELHGGAGTDVIYVGDGGTDSAPTLIFAGDGNTTIHGEAGTAHIFGGSGTDVIYAGDGGTDDAPTEVLAGTGDTTIYGGAGSAILEGGSGSNVLVAGTGNQTLIGGTGSNTFIFDPDAGNVVISDSHGAASGDVLEFDGDVTVDELTVTGGITSDGDAALEIDGNGSVLLLGALAGSKTGFKFGSGETLSEAALLQQANVVSDTVVGANGDLVFDVDTASQITASSGQDTIVSWGGHATLSGGGGNALIVAMGGYDLLQGGSGADTLDGAGIADTLVGGSGETTLVADAAVTMIAGAGKTTFVVNNSAAIVQAAPGSSDDVVLASVSYTLADNLTQLTLTGSADLTATSNDLNDIIIGNAGNDVLQAGDGNSTLIAGSGIDTLIGGYGNDTFVVNNIADVVQAHPWYGGTILSSVSFALPDSVQNLTLTGSADLTATGNGTYAILTGNAGNDTLIAGSGGSTTLIAGTGLATLIGGTSGSDSFVINNEADVVQAKAGAYNTVQTSVSYAAGANVRDITGTGTADLVLTGNSLDSQITANSGNDTLIAGTGHEVLIGGGGVDSFVLGSQFNAEIVNTAGGGTLHFGPGVTAGSLRFAVTSGRDGAPALTVSAGSSTVVIDDAFDGSISHYTFADGSSATLDQLLAATASGVSSLSGGYGDFVLGVGGNDSLNGGGGRDTLVGFGNNDTLVAGSGGTLLVAHGTGSVLVGGSGGDTLEGGSGNTTFIAGTGADTLIGGQGGDTYNLTAGAFTTIQATTTDGTETIWLPAGMSMSDFTAVRVNGDLVLQSSATATTAVVHGFFGTQPSNRQWVMASDSEIPQYLSDWVARNVSSVAGEPAYSATAAAVKSTFSANLAVNRAALAGHWLTAAYAEASGYTPYDYWYGVDGMLGSYRWDAPTGPATIGQFQFSGVSTVNYQVTAGQSYQAPAAEEDLLTTTVTSVTVTSTVPIYGTASSGGQVIPVPFGYAGAIPSGWDYQMTSDQFGNWTGSYLVSPVRWKQVQTGTRTVTSTYDAYSTSSVSGFTISNITTDDSDVSIYGSPAFGGTITLGNGNDYVYLPNGAPPLLTWDSAAPVLGAFMQAGSGNDTIFAGYGQNTIIAGSGFDYINGGGLTQVNGEYGGPYEGSTGEPDTIYVPLSGNATEVIRISNVEYLDSTGQPETTAQNTLVLPAGITAADLKYRLFDATTDYWDGQALQLSYGNSNVIIKLGTTVSQDSWGGNDFWVVDGLQRFQFADGTVLTLSQLMAQATLMTDDIDGTVSAQDQTLAAGQVVAASSLFSVPDAGDNNGSLWYRFSTFPDTDDEPADSSYFTLNGVQQSDTFVVSAAQLAELQYVAGAAGYVDDVEITAFAGGSWGTPADFQITVAGSTQTTVETATSYTAAAGVLNVIGTGSADITLTGNDLANVITANDGNDTLVAGSGVATLIGGAGNDTFVINNDADVVQAQPGGINTIRTSVSYTASGNVQSIVGTGSADLVLIGNDLIDTITANTGNDSLIAGSGDATLVGGSGNDSFVGGQGKDTFVIGLGGGQDVIDDSAKAGVGQVSLDVIQFGAGISLQNLVLSSQGDDLSITGRTPSSVSVLLRNAALSGANDNLVIDQLAFADGSSAVFRSDQSGGWLADESDGQGNTAETDYNADGSSTRDWTSSDGSHGHDATDVAGNVRSTVHLANGTSTGSYSNVDGTHGISSDDGQGNTSETDYNADGSSTRDWTASDGSHGHDATDAAGDVRSTTHLANGTSTGSYSNVDGTHGTWSDDGQGNTLEADYATDGAMTRTWTASDGSKGTDYVGTTTGSGDTFAWGRGSGTDTIQTFDATDRLAIGAGVARDQLWLRQDGNDLDISILGSSDQMVVKDWYASAANELQSISLADGETLLGTDVQKLVDAMASFAPPDAAQTQYTAQENQSLQPLLAANWH